MHIRFAADNNDKQRAASVLAPHAHHTSDPGVTQLFVPFRALLQSKLVLAAVRDLGCCRDAQVLSDSNVGGW